MHWIWFFVTAFSISSLLKVADKKNGQWCRKRYLYLFCYTGITFIGFMLGLQTFIDLTKYYRPQIAVGIMAFMFAVVPCGVEFFNSLLILRVIRNLFFITMGLLLIIFL